MNNTKSIYRVEKNKNFTTISNAPFKNDKLSLRAKGLFAYILVQPDDWYFHLEEVSKHSTESYKLTIQAFNELGLAGYVSVRKLKNSHTNLYSGREYTIYEEPSEDRIVAFAKYLDGCRSKAIREKVEIQQDFPTYDFQAVGKQ